MNHPLIEEPEGAHSTQREAKLLRVLVLEDSQDDAELVLRELKRGGYRPEWARVASAEDLRTALVEGARGEPWDIVISDHDMQGFDAPTALRIVRELAPELPFIIVSGSVGEELAVQAIRAGAQDFFLKDRIERLPNAVAHEVGEARHRAEKKEALERLYVSEARFRALAEQVIVGILQTDLEGRFDFANEKFCEIVGRPVAELRSLREHDITHPADLPAYERLLAGAHDGERAFAVVKRYVRPSGQEVWVNANVTVVVSTTGVRHIVSVVDDITDRRQIERDRERLVATLERAVKVSEMFVGVLGHDLRNPLQTITMASTLLLRPNARDVAVNAGRILKAGDRMRRMIDQLLDFTRMRMGKGIPLVVAPVDLGELARHAIDEIAVGNEGSEVVLDVDGDPLGRWDRDRLLQLLSNLIANAVDHREKGAPVRVSIDGRASERVGISVQNRGVIPAAILPLIFEPLQTTKRTKQDRASGLGLGLFITRQIARAHGGSIRVESNDAHGTEFLVELPREANDDTTSQQASTFDVLTPGSDRRPE